MGANGIGGTASVGDSITRISGAAGARPTKGGSMTTDNDEQPRESKAPLKFPWLRDLGRPVSEATIDAVLARIFYGAPRLKERAEPAATL
jgi:hypothetical protein